MRAFNLRDLTETEWDGHLFRGDKSLARTLGWTSYHTLRSKGSKSGYPDRTVWRERVLYAELKTEAKASQPTDMQIEILSGLAAAGAEVYLWRPSDLDEIAEILARRWNYSPKLNRLFDAQMLTGRDWRPKSMWLPTGMRSDQAQQLAISDALSAA